MVGAGWTERDLKTVTFVTVGNGLLLGFLLWLVLGLWLDIAGFVTCWIGATVISFPLAILEQRGEIESREIMDDLMPD
jgi:hypothetical protein